MTRGQGRAARPAERRAARSTRSRMRPSGPARRREARAERRRVARGAAAADRGTTAPTGPPHASATAAAPQRHAVDEQRVGRSRVDRLAQVVDVVLRRGAERRHRALDARRRGARAEVVVLDRLDRGRDRRGVEAARAHQRRPREASVRTRDVVAAARELVEDRHEREQVPARGRGVGQDLHASSSRRRRIVRLRVRWSSALPRPRSRSSRCQVWTSQIAIRAARVRSGCSGARRARRRRRARPSRSGAARRAVDDLRDRAARLHRGEPERPRRHGPRSGRAGCRSRRRRRRAAPAAAARRRPRCPVAPASSRPALEPKCRSSVCLVMPARAAIASSDAASQSPARNTCSAASSSAVRVRSAARARLTWV